MSDDKTNYQGCNGCFSQISIGFLLLAVGAYMASDVFSTMTLRQRDAIIVQQRTEIDQLKFQTQPIGIQVTPNLSKVDFEKESAALRKVIFDQPSKGTLDSVLDNLVFVQMLDNADVSLTDLNYDANKGANDRGLGQALVVTSDGHVITAAHVVRDYNDLFSDWRGAVIINKEKNVFSVDDILAVDLDHDLALVRTSYRPVDFEVPVFMTSDNLADGTDYTSVGRRWEGARQFFNSPNELRLVKPGEVDLPHYYSEGTFYGVKDVQYKNGRIAYRDMLLFEALSRPGFSGSVISDKSGRVFGLVSGGSDGPNQGLVASRGEHVKALIDTYLAAIPK